MRDERKSALTPALAPALAATPVVARAHDARQPRLTHSKHASLANVTVVRADRLGRVALLAPERKSLASARRRRRAVAVCTGTAKQVLAERGIGVPRRRKDAAEVVEEQVEQDPEPNSGDHKPGQGIDLHHCRSEDGKVRP